MPLGIERINARRKQPNDRIAFIKALEGPEKRLAEDFLERIAAICNPIMKANHLSIMSLEEYEPNLEFVGRNFNAGEVIQLVLRAPYTGRWLPFKYVQMVMMHELAHCNQMNHSGAFWKVRNSYATELRALWGRGYTGEGMWSRGITLVSGQYERDSLDAGEVLPEHLCGGTFRSSSKRKRKRKIKKVLGYKEREAKRISKKFGTDGLPLGADEETKVKLERGKVITAKPRVAGSVRGRELRAAAALARLETQKVETDVKEEEDDDSTIESADDSSDAAIEALDIYGKRILDRSGRGMIKVCEEEDKDDLQVQTELSELKDFDYRNSISTPTISDTTKDFKDEPRSSILSSIAAISNFRHDCTTDLNLPPQSPVETTSQESTTLSRVSCPVCSMENDGAATICFICSNVLDLKGVPNIWRCQSGACQAIKYVNAGDCGLCGICGARNTHHGI